MNYRTTDPFSTGELGRMIHRIRASIIIPDGDRVLLVEALAPAGRPSIGGMSGCYWNFPGGGLENDESVLDGAAREAQEETGLTIVAERVVYVHEVVSRLRPIRQVELYVLASRFDGPLALKDSDVRTRASSPAMNWPASTRTRRC